MPNHVLVFDLETVPDLPGIARAHGLDEADEAAAREALGEKFPKLAFHKIACIGALIAERVEGLWLVRSLGAPHLGERSEGELIASFVDRIAELRPRLITFNGGSFDLPVLRYRAMVNTLSAPGLTFRAYFHQFTDDALDLCDCLASFSPNGRVKLHELCRALGLPGKPDEIDGSKVDDLVRAGRIEEVSSYCETDVVSTYRVWLRHELFRGMLTEGEFAASEENLLGYLSERLILKPHLVHLLKGRTAPIAVDSVAEVKHCS